MDPKEISEEGWRIYRERLQTTLEPAQTGRIVAIDVETGDHFVADEPGLAARAAHAKHPGARVFCIRIGFPSVYRVGVRWPTRS